MKSFMLTQNLLLIFSTSDDTFLKGRCAKILVNGKAIGWVGVLHPTVVTNFELTLPASAVELNLEPLAQFALENAS